MNDDDDDIMFDRALASKTLGLAKLTRPPTTTIHIHFTRLLATLSDHLLTTIDHH